MTTRAEFNKYFTACNFILEKAIIHVSLSTFPVSVYLLENDQKILQSSDHVITEENREIQDHIIETICAFCEKLRNSEEILLHEKRWHGPFSPFSCLDSCFGSLFNVCENFFFEDFRRFYERIAI